MYIYIYIYKRCEVCENFNIRPCQIDFLFSVTHVHAKKTRRIEPFYSKISTSIPFIYYK